MASITIQDGNGNLQNMQVTTVSGNNLSQVIVSDTTATAFSVSNPFNVTPAVFSYKHINSAATTTVKSSAGTLHTISINSKAASSSCTVYDNATGSGTVIAVLDTVNFEGSLTYDVLFATGLTLVTTGTPDITVTYR
jgi:hypothetical protein